MQESQIAATAFLKILSSARSRIARQVENDFRLAKVANEQLRKVVKQLNWDDLHLFMIIGLELCKSGNDLSRFYNIWRNRFGPCTLGPEVKFVSDAMKKSRPREVRELVEKDLFTRNDRQPPAQMTLVSSK
jgi:hypothetical protein